MLNLSHDTAALVCADVHVPPTNVYLVPLAVHNLPDGLTSVYTMFIKWQLYLLRDQMPSLTTDLPKFHLVEIWIRKTAFSKCIPFPFFVGSHVKTNDCPNKKKTWSVKSGAVSLMTVIRDTAVFVVYQSELPYQHFWDKHFKPDWNDHLLFDYTLIINTVVPKLTTHWDSGGERRQSKMLWLEGQASLVKVSDKKPQT